MASIFSQFTNIFGPTQVLSGTDSVGGKPCSLSLDEKFTLGLDFLTLLGGGGMTFLPLFVFLCHLPARSSIPGNM